MGLFETLENDTYNNKIMVKYIKYILKKADIVLCIESSQNFDKTSLDVLSEILIETKQYNNFFIFEFTLDKSFENLDSLERIKNELDYSEIVYEISELKKLELKYVLELAKKLCNSADVSYISKVEQIYTGNIKKIENFAFNYSVQTVNNCDPTLELLQGLSKSQKYILAILILNNSNIKEEVLKQILYNSNGIYLSNYNEEINYLLNEINLIEKRADSICIKDGDTVESWKKNNENFIKYETLAYKNCEIVLLRILRNGIEYSMSRKECIFLLFQLYNKFDAIKLNNILNLINEVIYEMVSINDLEKYIKKIIITLYDKESSLNILYKIFDICNRHQLIDLEGFCLNKISTILQENYDEKYLYCYYTNLLQREEYQFLLEQIALCEDFELSVDFKYYLALFKIVAHVSLNQAEEYKKIVDTLNNDIIFFNKIQYGYFLRLAEAYDKRNVAISKVEKSVEIFSEFGMDDQMAKSKVSLAFLYSITGELEKAQIALDSSQQILLKNIENRHIFNINKACLCLLNKTYTEEVWDLLAESEKYAYTRFDKIAIIINKIIWCIENGNFGKGKYCERKGLELLELEYNHHLHAIFYYNCYALYKAMDETTISQKYYNMAINYKEYCNTLKARLEGKNEVEDQTTFLLQYPWHVCFVSYWHFDYISQDLSIIS